MFDVDKNSIDNSRHIEDIMTAGSRWFLVLVNIIILIMSLSGNVIVLYGSIVHNALRLDRITLLLVQNVALADIIIALLFYLPAMVNLIAGRWALGYGLCFVNGWISLVPSVCEIITMTMLSVYRLVLIMRKVSKSTRQNLKPWGIALVSVWGGISLLPFLFSILDFKPYYDPYTQSCNSADMNDDEKGGTYKVAMIACLNIFLNLIPMIIITTSNIFILVCIYKTASNVPKKNSLPMRTVKTIPLICLLFVLSYFPHAVACLSNFGVTLADWWRTVSFYFQALNTVSNPLIYVAVNLEFRRYVLGLIFYERGERRNTMIFNRDSSTPSSTKPPSYQSVDNTLDNIQSDINVDTKVDAIKVIEETSETVQETVSS